MPITTIQPQRLFIVGLTALLLQLVGTPARANAEDEARTRAKLQEVTRAIAGQQERIDLARGQESQAVASLREAEKQLSRTAAEIRNVEKAIMGNRTRLLQLEREQRALEKKIERQKALLRDEVIAAYSTGREAQLKLLLNQENPETISRLLRYYDFFYEARIDKVEQFRIHIASLDAVQDDIRKGSAELEDNKRKLADKQQALEATRQARDTLVAKMRARVKTEREHLQDLEESRSALQQVLETLNQAIATLKTAGDVSFPKSRGKLPWPVDGKVVSYYGEERENSTVRTNGITIAGNKGAQVRAVAYGRVVYADWLRGFGMLTIIDHGGGHLSLYGNNESLWREPGDWVNAGDVIATMGKSGGKNETALYFEIRVNGKPQNPRQWLRKR